MSEANKALARKSFEALSTGDLDKALDMYSDDVTYHSTDGDFSGRDAMKEYISVYYDAFSNIGLSVEDVIAEGDKVVSRVTGSGTHTGELQGMPPTGKNISISGISIMRIADGKIAEEWEMYDIMGMMQQLGAIPAQ